MLNKSVSKPTEHCYQTRLMDVITEKQQFLTRYPSFKETSTIDELRSRENESLDRPGHVYFDYTGG